MHSSGISDIGEPLEIARDARRDDDCFFALSQEPWLRFPSLQAFRPGGFVELRYAASLYDPPVRPVLRFWLGRESYREHILAAPCEGAGVWLGRVPKETTDVWISPTNRPGPFSFHVLEARPATLARALRQAANSLKRLFFAVSPGMVGLLDEPSRNCRWALGGAPISIVRHGGRRAGVG